MNYNDKEPLGALCAGSTRDGESKMFAESRGKKKIIGCAADLDCRRREEEEALVLHWANSEWNCIEIGIPGTFGYACCNTPSLFR